jgi:hypothetical protein
MLAAALVLGGNIRWASKITSTLPSGEMAKSNGALVEVAARMTRDVGRRPPPSKRRARSSASERRRELAQLITLLVAFEDGRALTRDAAQPGAEERDRPA